MGVHAKDLRFQKFGRLIVLHRALNLGDRVAWICMCECGNLCIARSGHLTRGSIVSCGCFNREINSQLHVSNLAGQRFGKLVVIQREGSGRHREALWRVRCDCGNETVVFATALTSGNTTSCGCNRLGENNWNWKGGISFEPYCRKWTNELREHIRDKFGRRCVVCGKSESDNLCKRLCVHHIDYNKQQGCSGRRWELIPLCHSCHTKTNGNRWYWYNLFHNFWVNSYTIPQ